MVALHLCCSFKLIHLRETEWEGIFFSNRPILNPINPSIDLVALSYSVPVYVLAIDI
jgi:hypothetical protein